MIPLILLMIVILVAEILGGILLKNRVCELEESFNKTCNNFYLELHHLYKSQTVAQLKIDELEDFKVKLEAHYNAINNCTMERGDHAN